jgi:hypothetical protein
MSIRNPGTIEKYKKGIKPRSNGRSNNMIRSVMNSADNMMINHCVVGRFLILFNIKIILRVSKFYDLFDCLAYKILTSTKERL